MVQCNPLENPIFFDGCCPHEEKIKFLLWHRVFVYTMEHVRIAIVGEANKKLSLFIYHYHWDSHFVIFSGIRLSFEKAVQQYRFGFSILGLH